MIRALIALLCLSPLIPAANAGDLSQNAQQQYERLTREFVAPCCWREPLFSHRSAAADAARQELQTAVEAGHSDAIIRKQFVNRYGEAILLVPEGGRGQWLVITPFVVAGGAIIFCVFFVAWLMKRRSRSPERDDRPVAEIDDAELGW